MAIMRRITATIVIEDNEELQMDYAKWLKEAIEAKRDKAEISFIGCSVVRDGYIVQDMKEDKAVISTEIGSEAKFDSEIVMGKEPELESL